MEEITTQNGDSPVQVEEPEKVPEEVPFQRMVTVAFTGESIQWHIEGGTVFELPVLLRRAATTIEGRLTNG